ncbi:uncharacterized protein LOC144357947 [Saccoglossus kowalevskii]
MSQRNAVTEVMVIDSQFDHFRDYIDIIQVYQCRICGYHSPLRHAIASHMSEVHFPKTCYLCQQCHFVYEDKAQLRHHLSSVHGSECTDDVVRYEAVHPHVRSVPHSLPSNVITASQFRQCEDQSVVIAHDINQNITPRSGLHPESFVQHSGPETRVESGLRPVAVSTSVPHDGTPLFHAENSYIQHVAKKSSSQHNMVNVKEEPKLKNKTSKAREITAETNSSIVHNGGQSEDKSTGSKTQAADNAEMNRGTTINDNALNSTEKHVTNVENDGQEKPKERKKHRSKPSLSTVLTNLAAQHGHVKSDETPGLKQTSCEQGSISSDGDSDSSPRNEKVGSSKTKYGSSVTAHYLTYKREQCNGLPPKKIKLEIIENPRQHQDVKPTAQENDGPYNADGSFDYYSLTGWKAYRCDLCNKGKRGRRVSFKTAQELIEHNFFVHGKPAPPAAHPVSNGTALHSQTSDNVRQDDPGAGFEMYRPPLPWPPGFHPGNDAEDGKVHQKQIPVLDLSVQCNPNGSTDTGSNSDPNGDGNSISSEKHQHHNDDDSDCPSDDCPSGNSPGYMSYPGENSDGSAGLIQEYPQDEFSREGVGAGFMGHKVRKTLTSRLAALQRGELSRKKDPKFADEVINSSYNPDGSFDYYSLTGWKAYKCELCKKRRFKTATELAEHKRAMHPGLLENNSTMLEELPEDHGTTPTSEKPVIGIEAEADG